MDTSHLIYGCGHLRGGKELKNSLAVIDAALECGIRRFDVAPSYGLGQAEEVLGLAIKSSGMKNHLQITSKYGIPRPRTPGLLSRARSTVKPVISLFPGFRPFILRRLQTSNKPLSALNANGLKKSVEDSLQRLGVERLCGLLLHEANPRAIDDDLVPALEDMKRAGYFSKYGSSTGKFRSDLYLCGTVEQFCTGSMALSRDPIERLVHGAIRSYLDGIINNGDHILRLLQINYDIANKNFLAAAVSLIYSQVISAADAVVFSTNSIDRLVGCVGAYKKIDSSFALDVLTLMKDFPQ